MLIKSSLQLIYGIRCHLIKVFKEGYFWSDGNFFWLCFVPGEKATQKRCLCVRWMVPSMTKDAITDLIFLTRAQRRPPTGYTLVGSVLFFSFFSPILLKTEFCFQRQIWCLQISYFYVSWWFPVSSCNLN